MGSQLTKARSYRGRWNLLLLIVRKSRLDIGASLLYFEELLQRKNMWAASSARIGALRRAPEVRL
jgi:hypothetical protein